MERQFIESVRRIFQNGFITVEQIEKLFSTGKITDEEKQYILNP